MKTFKFIKANVGLLILHLAFWCMLLLPAVFFKLNAPSSFSSNFYYRMLINNLLLIGIFYVNAYYLFPVVFKRKNWLLYVVLVIATLVVAYFISKYVETDVFPPKRRWKRSFFPDLFGYLFIVGISCSYRIVVDYLKNQKLAKEKENENLKTELSFLRSQVSPHFMFNVLNNLVSLARKKSDKMEPALLQLSTLLRYMLYEGNDSRITIAQEISYLQGYINLQKLRFGDDVEVQFSATGETGDFVLEPMILIPFVENAFKHGMGTVERPKIKIDLTVKGKVLTFEVVNDVAPETDTKDKSHGIGLANTKRRLELLYGQNQELQITKSERTYRVYLKIIEHD
ncbi:sensor histidine kinase [Pelobium manganitolerans]|uniref:sensor histidine kinase n=1 Tax=Pelobium manganitolerans TaxID=1842495 RepID=UPI000E71A393|nr:histidine kinase [Pelobium manganitolerans]